MIASKSGDGADPSPSTNACTKSEYTKTREAYIELVVAGQTCICLLDTGSDVTLFPHALVRGLPLDSSKDVPLRMMKVRDVAVQLNKGATVAELQPVDVVETVTPPTKEERQQE